MSTESPEDKKYRFVGQVHLFSDEKGPKLQVDDLLQKWRSGRIDEGRPLLVYREEAEDESDGYEDTT